MKKNMGSVDRLIRIIAAIVIFVLFFTHRVGGTLGVILFIVAIVFLITSLVGHCPAYLPLKISTRRERSGSKSA
jgi:K+-transporting ATPase A subunit